MAQVLTKDEREIVLTLTDAEDRWSVFTDSRRAFSTRLLKVARALGVEVAKTGFGWEFSLPLKALRVAAPRRLSEAEAVRMRARGKSLGSHRGKPTQNGIPGGGPNDDG